MEEFMWRRADIHDAITSIEDITSDFNVHNAFIYKIPNGNKYIFNNLSEFKESIKDVSLIMDSGQRSRMSFEVKGQPRTGKTLCSRYVLPYFCARTINEKRKRNGLSQLYKVPVFYLLLNKLDNPLYELYSLLKRSLTEIIGYHEDQPTNESDYVFGIQSYIEKYSKRYSNSHMFIILDEIQLVESRYLDKLRMICKSRDIPKCTFILTGSTMSMVAKTLDDTYRNGLSYFENNIVFEIPFSNDKKEITESLEVLKKWGFVNRVCLTRKEIRQVRMYCSDVNVAYANQILQHEHDQKNTFDDSLTLLLDEIFKIFERDINVEENAYTYLVKLVLSGDLEGLEVFFPHFVRKSKKVLYLTDKLLMIFLNSTYTISSDNQIEKKPNLARTQV